MKIEELIEKLKEIKDKQGNIEVVAYDSCHEYLTPLVSDVKFAKNETEERQMFYDKAQMYDNIPVCVIVC